MNQDIAYWTCRQCGQCAPPPFCPKCGIALNPPNLNPEFCREVVEFMYSSQAGFETASNGNFLATPATARGVERLLIRWGLTRLKVGVANGRLTFTHRE